MADIFRDIGSIIQFNQTVKSNPYAAAASNTFVILQSTRVSPFYLRVSSRLSLFDHAVLANTVRNLSVLHHITFTQVAVKVIPLNLMQTFFVFHAARTFKGTGANQFFGLNQSVLVERIRPARSTLHFTQTVSVIGSKSPHAANTLVMTSSATCYKLDRRFIAITITMPTPPGGDDGHGP